METDQKPQNVASELGLHCLHMSHKKALGLYRLIQVHYEEKTQNLPYLLK